MTEDKNQKIEEEKKNNEAAENTAPQTEAPAEKKAEEKTDAEKLAEAEAQIAEYKDKYLRQVAEFDNYRKRTIKEKTELILNGGSKVLEALLPVLDDLERAADNMEKSDDVATLKEGVSLILGKLEKTLSAQGLKKMETIGQSFDTDFHEAIALVPAQEEAQKNHVIDCVQTGYLLNDKVLRHAKVVVGQ